MSFLLEKKNTHTKNMTFFFFFFYLLPNLFTMKIYFSM